MRSSTQPSQSFKRLCKYLGWGNPKGKVWFVGLEPGGDGYTSLKDVVKMVRAKKSLVAPYEGVAGGHVAEKEAQILSGLRSDGDNQWRAYIRDHLWTKEGVVLHANIFPLDRPGTDRWPPQYKRLFGFGAEDWDEYVYWVEKLRWPLLRKLKEEVSPTATICFGSSFRAYFKTAFGLLESVKSFVNEPRIVVYEKERVILTPFLGRRQFFEADKVAVIDVLRRWGL